MSALAVEVLTAIFKGDAAHLRFAGGSSMIDVTRADVADALFELFEDAA